MHRCTRVLWHPVNAADSLKARFLRILVLSRKKNEGIVINDDIVVTIVEIRGDKVRLGIDAPRDVPVHRREVLDAILREEELAGQSGEKQQGS